MESTSLRTWAAILALAMAGAAQPQFTNTVWELHAGSPFNLTWNGDDLSFPVILRLWQAPETDTSFDRFLGFIACKSARPRDVSTEAERVAI